MLWVCEVEERERERERERKRRVVKDDDDNECGNDELPVGFCGEEKGGSTEEEYDETRNYEEHGSDA